MGTIEEYFDYCISKYPGYKVTDYGKINYGAMISSEQEQYIYSTKCINDICDYYEELGKNKVELKKAYHVLKVKKNENRDTSTYIPF